MRHISVEHILICLLNYEPDGNIPPDFLFGDTAIEVRRLNENRIVDGEIIGLEGDQIRINSYLENNLSKIAVLNCKKYFVFANIIARPIEIGRPLLNSISEKYKSANSNQGYFTSDHGSIQLDWMPCENDAVEDAISYGGITDNEQASWSEDVYQSEFTDNCKRKME